MKVIDQLACPIDYNCSDCKNFKNVSPEQTCEKGYHVEYEDFSFFHFKKVIGCCFLKPSIYNKAWGVTARQILYYDFCSEYENI